MVRIIIRTLAGIFFLVLLAYPIDWAIWRIRVAAGGGMDQVTLNQVTAAALKGNKDEYYFDGTIDVDCSRSLFPQGGSGACWWLRRHKDVITQY